MLEANWVGRGEVVMMGKSIHDSRDAPGGALHAEVRHRRRQAVESRRAALPHSESGVCHGGPVSQ